MMQVTLRQYEVNVVIDKTSSGGRPKVMQRKGKHTLIICTFKAYTRIVKVEAKMKILFFSEIFFCLVSV